eukprot:TRINITY_DN2070_c1_g1_i1.p1 TRINITY_DN2070_c1_g1~~TRINITY_DN2070_c1_g1_i1.p1  ORF type:complete len:467 (+),score=90.80 TRINITY_DN2070_c1_g1_i1:142-1542(+)
MGFDELKEKFKYIRWSIVFLLFSGIIICYLFRLCISTAILDMDFDWTKSETKQGVVLSSFYYGYILTQIVGGLLAERYGAKYVFLGGVIGSSFFTILTPLSASNFYAIIIIRILTGFCEGVTYPSMHVIFSYWIPSKERSTAVPIAWGGSYFGIVLSMFTSGYIVEWFGWASVFYIFGSLGFIWAIFWVTIASSKPESNRFISQYEIEYIKNGLNKHVVNHTIETDFDNDDIGISLNDEIDTTYKIVETNDGIETDKKEKIPYRDMLKCKAIYAAFVGHFAFNTIFYTLQSWLPSYFDGELGFSIANSSALSALPYIALWIVCNTSGFLSDILINKFKWKRVVVRKLSFCIGLVTGSYFLVWIAFIKHKVVVTLVIIAIGGSGLCIPGYGPILIDMTPKYSGFLFGISNTIATLPGMFGVLIAGILVDITNSFASVFIITAIISLAGAIIFGIFARADKVENEWKK